MLADLVSIQKQDVFAIHEMGDKKHAKFLGLFGFEFLQDFVGLDGQHRQIFVRRM
jgi:hypothetical protein